MSDSPEVLLSLTGALGIRDAARLAVELRALLAAPGPWRIDCGGLSEVDLAVVQLLVAAQRTASAAGGTLTVTTPAGSPLAVLLETAGLLAPAAVLPGIWSITEALAA